MAESICESKMNWGSFLSERQWGTVREDYSKDGDAWNYFSFEEAMTRAYRWGEGGYRGRVGGFASDRLDGIDCKTDTA